MYENIKRTKNWRETAEWKKKKRTTETKINQLIKENFNNTISTEILLVKYRNGWWVARDFIHKIIQKYLLFCCVCAVCVFFFVFSVICLSSLYYCKHSSYTIEIYEKLKARTPSLPVEDSKYDENVILRNSFLFMFWIFKKLLNRTPKWKTKKKHTSTHIHIM